MNTLDITPIINLFSHHYADNNGLFIWPDRIGQVRKELIEFEYLTREQLSRPDVVKMLEMWDAYINLPAENLQMYDKLKAYIINVMGEKYFQAYLAYTRFLRQTHYLIRKGLPDIKEYNGEMV